MLGESWVNKPPPSTPLSTEYEPEGSGNKAKLTQRIKTKCGVVLLKSKYNQGG